MTDHPGRPSARSLSRPLLALLLATQSLPALAEDAPPPLALNATYIGEDWHNTRGGLQRGSRYIDMLILAATLDTAATVGHPGGTFFANVFIHHNSAADLVGELQTQSNIDFDDGEQVFEAWYEQALGTAGSSLRLGLYDLNAEFDHIDAGGLFINSNFGIGVDFSQSGVNGPSIAPLSALALRGAWQARPDWQVLGALVDAVPGEAGASNRHNRIGIDAREGALLVAEVVHAPEGGARIGVGGWHYTQRFDSLLPAGAPVPEYSQGLYAHAEKGIGARGGRDWTGFARLGYAAPEVNAVQYGLEAGVVVAGPLWHADDQLGLAVSTARNGRHWRDAQAAAGAPVALAETIIELTWQTRLAPWLALQPDLQYFFNPGTDPARPDALFAGLRLRLDYGWP